MSNAERVADAIASNDQRALIALAIELAGQLDAETRRRAQATARKRRQREAASTAASMIERDIARQSVTSRDSAGQCVTPPSPPLPSPSSPTTLLTTSFPPPPPEQSESAEISLSETDLAVRLALSTTLGARLPDVQAFLRTRRADTWPAWMRQMLKIVGPGSPYTAEDLANACVDCLAVEQPIAGPHALRAFVAKHRQERVAPSPAIRAGAAASEADAAGERRHRSAVVMGRRARGSDGDLWWARMERDAAHAHRNVWEYAFHHIHEPGHPDAA